MAKAKKKKVVVCATCNKEYGNIFSLESNQAYGCASDLIKKDGKIISYSHYGSKLDTMKHNFKELGDHNLGTICDDCIIKAKESGIAEEDETYDYFAPLDHIRDLFAPSFLKE